MMESLELFPDEVDEIPSDDSFPGEERLGSQEQLDVSPENIIDSCDLASQSYVEVSESVSLTDGDPLVLSSPKYSGRKAEEYSGSDLVSEHDSKSRSSLIIANHDPTVEEKQTYFVGTSMNQLLDNTVDAVDEGNEPSISTNDNKTSLDLYSDLPIRLGHNYCLNRHEEFLNQNGNNELSETCALDLTEESNVVCSPHDDTLPAIEHPSIRHEITDSLVKDKNKSFYDTMATNESDDKDQDSVGTDDTLYLSGRSTNVTKGEYFSENNSNRYNYKTDDEASTLELSNEKYNPEPESFSLLDNTNIKNYDKGDDVSSKHRVNVNLKNEKNYLLCNKKTIEAENDSSLLINQTIKIHSDKNSEKEQEINKNIHTSEDSNQIDDKKTSSHNMSSYKAFNNVFDKEKNTDKEICDMEFDGSADLFNNSMQIEDNDKLPEGSVEKPQKNVLYVVEHQSVINKDLSEVFDKEKNLDKSSLDKKNVEEDMIVKTPKRVYSHKRKLKHNKEAQKQMVLFPCANLAETVTKSHLDVGMQEETKNTLDQFSSEKYKSLHEKSLHNDINNLFDKVQGKEICDLECDESADLFNNFMEIEDNDKSSEGWVEKPQTNVAVCNVMYVNEWCEESCKNDTVKRSSLYGGRTFPCQHCSFIGPSVDSILYHFKYCPSLKKIQYSANQASDQNKHQFPRSDRACENVNASFDKTRLKRIRLDNSNQSPKNSQDQPDTSTSLDDKEKRKFGFAEKDVVWIKVEKGWWPALVWETNKNSTLFYIIFYDHVEPLRTQACKKLDKLVHAFDDLYFTLKKLEKSEKMPTDYDKAVRKAISYCTRPKVPIDKDFDVKKYFNIVDYNKKVVSNIEEEKMKYSHESPNISLNKKDPTEKEITITPCQENNKESDQPGTSANTINDTKKDNGIDDIEQKLNFAEKDVVWIKKGSLYWPALVWKMDEDWTWVFIIVSSDDVKPLKLMTQSCKKLLHAFDDEDFTREVLEKSEKMPTDYDKAVRKASSYSTRIKAPVDDDFDVKKYFNIDEGIKEKIELDKWLTDFEIRKLHQEKN